MVTSVGIALPLGRVSPSKTCPQRQAPYMWFLLWTHLHSNSSLIGPERITGLKQNQWASSLGIWTWDQESKRSLPGWNQMGPSKVQKPLCAPHFLFVGKCFSLLGLPWVPKRRLSSVQFSSVQFSHSVVSDSLRPHESQHARPPCPSQIPGVYSNYAHQVSDAIQPSHPLSSPSLPAPNPSQHQGLYQWVNSSHEVAKVLEFQFQHQSFQWTPRTDLLQDGLVGSPCNPRDSQESSPTPQFKSINFLALSFLHSPTLTSIHDHWKNRSLDQMDLCWQSNVSAF